MKRGFNFVSASLFLISSIFLLSCNHNRQVVPDDTDIDEVLKPLSPNDEQGPGALSFGEQGIPGFVLDDDITTDNSEVYIFFENLTVLDLKPEINNGIFDYIISTLKDYCFVKEDFPLSGETYGRYISSGMNYQQAVTNITDSIKSGFAANYEDQIAQYNSAFNINFRIFPVYLDKDCITYILSDYVYTGGAHGITSFYIQSYDLSTGKALSVNDIVRPDAMTAVREEVAARMAYSYPIYENITTVNQYLDSLNVWIDHFSSVEVPGPVTIENFPLTDPGITKEGLVFIYQMYELTPGSDGCPMVLIPYRDLRGCLTGNFEK